MTTPLSDTELRSEITALRRERDAHQMDESDYTDKSWFGKLVEHIRVLILATCNR